MDTPIDYLAIGHICDDITPDGTVTGGTVAYAGRTAQVLGCQTAVFTSSIPGYDYERALPGIHVHSVSAPATTTFENIYTPTGRQQTIHAVAHTLTAGQLPPEWRRAAIVHLAPVASEVDPALIQLFSNSLVGMTPQGWLRRWDNNGHVYARDWPAAPHVLPLAAAVILSEEDLLNEHMLDQYRQWARLLVLTQGEAGCTVFCGGEVRQFPAPSVEAVEATGAGDIFAAAFLIRLRQTAGNHGEAARFANEIASQSVTQAGLDAKITRIRHYLAKND